MSLADNALGRLAYQYRNATRFRALVAALINEYDDIYKALLSLETRLDIEASEGVQLDQIGEIVGQPRPDSIGSVYLEFPPEEAFAFAGGVGQGFSGIGRPDVGGRFAGLSGVAGMIDADYRVLLRAAIFRNYADCTIDSMGQYGLFVFGARITVLNGVGFVDVSVQKPLRGWERRLIEETFPVAAGVRLRLKSFSLQEKPFSFSGNDDGRGFGGVGVEQDGGGFVGLF
jgi:hypothetical protein